MKQGPLTIGRVSVLAGQQQLTPDGIKSVPYLSREAFASLISRENEGVTKIRMILQK